MEAGPWHIDAVAAWPASPNRDRCARVLFGLPDGLDQAAADAEADQLLQAIRAGGTHLPVLLHSEGSSCLPALHQARRRGLAARIGLEDVLELPDGSPAPDNAALVRAARAFLPRSP